MSKERMVNLREDIEFARREERPLKCDVFTPDGLEGPAPAVLLIHGGAWKLGDKTQLRGYGFLLGREGFVCVAPQYRLSGEAVWPAQIDDVDAALHWVQDHAAELGVDPARISMLGHSSGGHLALLAAARNARAAGRPPVAAIYSFYAPVELTPGAEMLREFVDDFLGQDADAATYRDASPVQHLAPGFPPTMILQSNADAIVPRSESLKLYEALIACGSPVELHMFDRVQHAFDTDKGLARLCVGMIKNFSERYAQPTLEAAA